MDETLYSLLDMEMTFCDGTPKQRTMGLLSNSGIINVMRRLEDSFVNEFSPEIVQNGII